MEQGGRRDKGRIFVVSGPSGSGKTTLLGSLFKNKGFKKNLVKSVSLTTRPKRSGERDRKDYFFITRQEFLRRKKAKKILEWTKYLGYYYATPRELVDKHLKAGRHIILCLDLKGAVRIKRLYPRNSITIFIVPPSLRALKHRIEGRSHETKSEEVSQRIGLAKEELAASRLYDYRIENRSLLQAVRQLEGVILTETNNIAR